MEKLVMQCVCSSVYKITGSGKNAPRAHRFHKIGAIKEKLFLGGGDHNSC